MKFNAALSNVLLAASAVVAAPTSTLEVGPSRVDSAIEKRSTTFCGSFGSETAGPYIFYHNNWGASAASSGSQCTTFNDLQSNTASWSTSWTWAGGSSSVKSYSNVALPNVNKQLKSVSTINSIWKWSYTGSSIVADVAYDLWLAPTSGGTNKYEIMVWLAAYGGAGPISSTGSTPIATTTIAGHTWKLYSGPNGDTTVYSFVADSTITSFSGDLNLFFKYLTSSQGVSTSMYITSLQAGTEPFTGSNAVMTTSSYTISVR
ncbi:glycoside hydrolase family 12 protein [Diaporthe amygdali]|uniref:glycoside hydrolase family 12 protein n=1 Tax=Phomopsis amygdali TaxID=1214568 RepID=UPI0022FE6A2D|nr:glycoside hydrolase family 12 protein [Diaporthe amygdali]KAJ0106979.1 glycoside hydrolase family 12 protein [Diaporthe amygdali]